jgi:hypothetical protein
MPSAVFETAIPATKLPQTYISERVGTGADSHLNQSPGLCTLSGEFKLFLATIFSRSSVRFTVQHISLFEINKLKLYSRIAIVKNIAILVSG